ncbi:MAG: hemolysin III family protein [Firmicutes bacterium]|nr:hemolysin III family protein [Bacillota bacterium]
MSGRTKLADRTLPDYTRGNEIFNMVSHIVGGALGLVALVSCVAVAAAHHNLWGVWTSVVYGVSMITLYTISATYHGLKGVRGKKVMQVLDHCTIYFLIAGTYTPVTLTILRPAYPAIAWCVFGIVWGCAVLASVFTAIDLKQYRVFSMICYLAMGWCIIFFIRQTAEVLTPGGTLWLVAGGIAYTIGAVLYGIGKKWPWMHGVFHVFVVIGSFCHYMMILLYVV